MVLIEFLYKTSQFYSGLIMINIWKLGLIMFNRWNLRLIKSILTKNEKHVSCLVDVMSAILDGVSQG